MPTWNYVVVPSMAWLVVEDRDWLFRHAPGVLSMPMGLLNHRALVGLRCTGPIHEQDDAGHRGHRDPHRSAGRQKVKTEARTKRCPTAWGPFAGLREQACDTARAMALVQVRSTPEAADRS